MAWRVVRGLLVGAALILFSQLFFFYYRDNFSTHYPVKAVSAAAFRQLDIPFWNFAVGGGQPLAGNPNTLTFYPDNVFYLFLRTQTAFNLHFLIHLLAGALAIRALSRRYGVDESSATLTALMYALSGPVISALAFYNLITAVALIPLAFLAFEILLERPGLGPSLVLGGVFGLLALAGEPTTFLGTLLATAILGGHRFLRPLADGPSPGSTEDEAVAVVGGQRSESDALTHWPPATDHRPQFRLAALVLWGLVAVVVTVLISLPLVLSYDEISSEVDRSTWKFSTQTVLAASLTPAQIAESVLGPYRGLVTDLGPAGLRGNPSERGWPPLFLSTFLGALLPAALFVRGRAAAPYRWMFAILLLIAIGRYNPLIESLLESFPDIRIFRYPEKLLLPMTTGALVLVGLWLSRPEEADRPVRWGVIAASAIVLLIVLHLGVSSSQLSEVSRIRFGIAAVMATGTLALALSGSRALAVAITLILLGYWAVRAAPVDYAGPYRQKPAILEGAATGRLVRPVSDNRLVLPRPREAERYRLKAAMLDPVFGAVFGVEYGLDRSPDGMYYMLTRVVNERLEAVPLQLKLRYLRLHGCTTVLLQQEVPHHALRLIRAASIQGNLLYRYEVADPVPYVRAARLVLPVRSIQEAVRLLESESFDERGSIIAAATHSRLGSEAVTIRNVRRDGQTISFDIEAGSSVPVVVNETYFSRWDVRAVRRGAEERLDIFPANLDRLAFVVPAGRWRVELRFGRRRGLVTATWVLSSLLLLLTAFAAVRLSRARTASPAR